MLAKPQPPRIPLPKSWPSSVRSAVVHAIALARYPIVYTRAWPADRFNARARLAAEKDRFYQARASQQIPGLRPLCRATSENPEPGMGKVKIAETLCRAGLHLGVTTVGRIFKEYPQPGPEDAAPCTRVVTAKRPNHVWHVDLTAVPTSMGLWAPRPPLALPQCWPFCWWAAVVIDHYSRRVAGIATFSSNPTSVSVQHGLSPACQRRRFEPRARWPRTARCASPQAPVASSCSARIRLEVRCHWGRAHLPIVALRRAA
jgi:hypothetical protein